MKKKAKGFGKLLETNAKKKPKAAPKKPKAAPQKKPKAPSKAAFVRAQPATTSAAAVVEAGKKAGLTIQPAYVYFVRSSSKVSSSKKKPKLSKQDKKDVKDAKKVKAAIRKGKETVRKFRPADSVQKDKEFMQEVLKIGIERAKEIIDLVDRFGLK